MKTYYISADPSCAGKTYIYVNCPEGLLQNFLSKISFGCSQCRHLQELSPMDNIVVDYFVTNDGKVYSKLLEL